MPWKKRRMSSSKWRLLFFVLAAAVASGILACLAGSLLQKRGSELAEKYSAYKDLHNNYSDAEIKAALEKRGGSVDLSSP